MTQYRLAKLQFKLYRSLLITTQGQTVYLESRAQLLQTTPTILLYELSVEVLTVHGYELRLFTHNINVAHRTYQQ